MARQKRENAAYYSMKELYLAWRQTKEEQETLRSRVAGLETENSTLKARLQSLRRAAAPSTITKVETTEAMSTHGYRSVTSPKDGIRPPHAGILLPAVPGNFRRPCTAASSSRLSSDSSTADVGSKVAELERKIATIDRKRIQEVSRWRKKYDELQERWMKRGSVEPPDDRGRNSRTELGKKGSLYQRSRSRVGTSSSNLVVEELRLENEQFKERNRLLAAENEELLNRLEEEEMSNQTVFKGKSDVNRKLRDLLDRSERKVEELQHTNLKLHSLLKDTNYRLRCGSRSSFAKDKVSLSMKRLM
eukprot:m.3433 g.3433  ORF g.3433 m.3433 type:complete len:304 (+) comp9377_c0_seq1:30-941(+)